MPTITGDHESRVSNVSSVIVMATRQGGAEIRTDGKALTLTAVAGMSGNNQPVLCIRERCGCAGGGKGLLIQKDRSGTLAANNDQFVLYNGESITNKTNQSNPKPNDPSHTLGGGQEGVM